MNLHKYMQIVYIHMCMYIYDIDCINAKTSAQVQEKDASLGSENYNPRISKFPSLDVSYLNHLYDIFHTRHLIFFKKCFSSIS